jgi:hypothetical protein
MPKSRKGCIPLRGFKPSPVTLKLATAFQEDVCNFYMQRIYIDVWPPSPVCALVRWR